MKKLFALLLTITLSCSVMALNVWDGTSEPWTNGEGTEDNPYLIETASNLAFFAEKVNEGYQAVGMRVFEDTYFLMTDDLDLNDLNWTPIGNANMSMQGFYFAGVFDGRYHYIDHLRITSNADGTALFAGLGGHGVIKHLSVTNGNITSSGMGAGGIAGAVAGESLVLQCSFSGNITLSNSDSYSGAGGIVAAATEFSKVQECSFSGSIHVTNNGGFMGAAGAGGISAIALDDASIHACYNAGSITASAMLISVAAGIVGATVDENNVKVSQCYNVGTVSALNKGGIFGMISPINPTKAESSIVVSMCYYLNTCGGTNSYGTSLTAEQMRTEGFKDEIDQQMHAYVMDNGSNNGYPIHAMVDFKVDEASEITCDSARLSAWIHQGNDSIVKASFYYKAFDDPDWMEVEVPSDGYVAALLDSLQPDTDYEYVLTLQFADSVLWSSPTKVFRTEEYDYVASVSVSPIQVYPNPATDVIFIQDVDASEVLVFNLMGQLVRTFHDTNELPVVGLAQGTYLLRVIDANGRAVSVPVLITDSGH